MLEFFPASIRCLKHQIKNEEYLDIKGEFDLICQLKGGNRKAHVENKTS